MKFFISILIILSVIFFCIKEFKNLLAYITLPVFIILSLLSNKELRIFASIISALSEKRD